MTPEIEKYLLAGVIVIAIMLVAWAWQTYRDSKR